MGVAVSAAFLQSWPLTSPRGWLKSLSDASGLLCPLEYFEHLHKSLMSLAMKMAMIHFSFAFDMILPLVPRPSSGSVFSKYDL